MRICLVGHHVDHPDEAVRKITHHLAEELARRHDVLRVNVWDVTSWRGIREFKPEIIHFVLSPTLQGLAVAKVSSLAHRSAATVVSAPHPDLSFLGRMASWFKPDLVLVQAEDSERRFRSLGFRTAYLPNGVETARFVPVDTSTKNRMREKHDIETDKFVILHVGAVNRGRNLESLQRVQGAGVQVLIVGRASERGDAGLAHELRQSGCLVWTHYVACLEEIYALSDCYVFSTTNRRYCVEMPLSVLEAMSCNLPVITTRFGALPRFFDEGYGLVFVDREDDPIQAVQSVKEGLETGTREKVLPYSWSEVVQRLQNIYERLVPGQQTTASEPPGIVG
jgi:glycosyltransferase involved in cell wall biosynthesis